MSDSISWQNLKYDDMTDAQKKAVKNYQEKGYLPAHDTVNADDFKDFNIFEDETLATMKKAAENNSAFEQIEKAMGVENFFALIDTDGNEKISSDEKKAFDELSDQYQGYESFGASGFDFLKLCDLAMNVVITAENENTNVEEDSSADDAAKVDDTPAADDATKVDDTPAADDSKKADETDNTKKTDDGSVVVKGLKKDYDSKNDEITVTQWGKKPADGDQNDCLLRIIQNNYGKDIKYGTDEYWAIANAVMDANPEIYDSGRKLVGGTKKDSSVIYTGEKIKLPNLKTEATAAKEAQEAQEAQEEQEEQENPSNGNLPKDVQELSKTGISAYIADTLGAKSYADTTKDGKTVRTYYDADGKEVATSIHTSGPLGNGGYTTETFDLGNGKTRAVKTITTVNNGKPVTTNEVVETDKDGSQTYKVLDNSGNVTSTRTVSAEKTLGTKSDCDKYLASQFGATSYQETNTDGKITRTYYDKDGKSVATSERSINGSTNGATTTETVTANGKKYSLVTKSDRNGETYSINEIKDESKPDSSTSTEDKTIDETASNTWGAENDYSDITQGTVGYYYSKIYDDVKSGDYDSAYGLLQSALKEKDLAPQQRMKLLADVYNLEGGDSKLSDYAMSKSQSYVSSVYNMFSEICNDDKYSAKDAVEFQKMYTSIYGNDMDDYVRCSQDVVKSSDYVNDIVALYGKASGSELADVQKYFNVKDNIQKLVSDGTETDDLKNLIKSLNSGITQDDVLAKLTTKQVNDLAQIPVRGSVTSNDALKTLLNNEDNLSTNEQMYVLTRIYDFSGKQNIDQIISNIRGWGGMSSSDQEKYISLLVNLYADYKAENGM